MIQGVLNKDKHCWWNLKWMQMLSGIPLFLSNNRNWKLDWANELHWWLEQQRGVKTALHSALNLMRSCAALLHAWSVVQKRAKNWAKGTTLRFIENLKSGSPFNRISVDSVSFFNRSIMFKSLNVIQMNPLWEVQLVRL